MLQTASCIILEATHKPDTGVSISAVYIHPCHAMLTCEEVQCLGGPWSSTALSNIWHLGAERVEMCMLGEGCAHFVVNNTETTWIHALIQQGHRGDHVGFLGPSLYKVPLVFWRTAVFLQNIYLHCFLVFFLEWFQYEAYFLFFQTIDGPNPVVTS